LTHFEDGKKEGSEENDYSIKNDAINKIITINQESYRTK